MLQVSIFIELLRSQPRVIFWLATLAQARGLVAGAEHLLCGAAGDLPQVLAMGHEFQLGTWQGPPLAYLAGRDHVPGRLACPASICWRKLCVIVTYWAIFSWRAPSSASTTR